MTGSRQRIALGVLAVSVTIGGCGGHSSSSSTTSITTSTSLTTTSTRPGSAVTTGPIRAVLRGQDHAPRVNKRWHYALVVTDAERRPLDGTVNVEFTFGSTVVGHDTPPVHTLTNGRLSGTLIFPARAVGPMIALQCVVHTTTGTATVSWPLRVRW